MPLFLHCFPKFVSISLLFGISLFPFKASAQGTAVPQHDLQLWPGFLLSAKAGKRFALTAGIWPVMFNKNVTRLEDGEPLLGANYALNRFVDFGVSYKYVRFQSTPTDLFIEHRYVQDITLRFPVRRYLALSDRNRVEWRLIDGSFSPRYTNRIQIEPTIAKVEGSLRPYVAFEALYNAGSGTWSKKRYFAGVKIRLAKHESLDIFYLRETDPTVAPRDIHAINPILIYRF
jgi:hypothetical protein